MSKSIRQKKKAKKKPMTDWPDYIPLTKAKLRERAAAQDAKCCIDGLAKAERVYVTPPAYGYRGMRVMYPLCHKHAVEWAAMK